VDLGDGGVNMNMLFKGIDLDLTQPGNDNACGVYHNGAQGSTVADVTVRAGNGTFASTQVTLFRLCQLIPTSSDRSGVITVQACFYGVNGAGGLHGNVECNGARYGLYIDGAQPVPMAVGVRLVNQSISAIVFNQQETLSLVGVTIVLPAWASGPALHNIGPRGMSLIDVSITCDGIGQTAIKSNQSTYLRDIYVRGPHNPHLILIILTSSS